MISGRVLSLSTVVVSVAVGSAFAQTTGVAIRWKKIVVDTKFRAEGAAVADVDKDGRPDVIVGNVWFQAPDWKVRKIREAKEDYRQGDANVYSESFAVFADDFNGDGWVDIVVIPFPGRECWWYENPKNVEGLWKRHAVWHSACNETPLYADLFGDGRKVVVMGFQPPGKENEGRMAWFEPGGAGAQTWKMHPISEPSTPTVYEVRDGSVAAMKKDGVPEAVAAKVAELKGRNFPSVKALAEAAGKVLSGEDLKAHGAKIAKHSTIPGKVQPGTHRFAHGLGVGDVNGDGRNDVIVPQGWWEQPPEGRNAPGPWKWHPAPLGQACADMYAVDVDGDGRNDVVSSSAHGKGLWWHKRLDDAGAEFQTFSIFEKFPAAEQFSQTHAMCRADINGDGVKDLITGKRWWAHGKTGDIDPNHPAVLYWIEIKRTNSGPEFVFHKIDDDSGIGTQFSVVDINGDGLLDIAVSNKKGTFVFLQERGK